MLRLGDSVHTDVPFSWNPIDDLQQLLQFEFMRNANVAGTAAAIAAGIVGYFVVLRSLSFAAHALTQMSFVGTTGARVAGVNDLFGLGVVNGISAWIIGVLGRRERGRDVVVGIVLTTALGLGLLFLRLYRAQEAVPILVGDVLGVNHTQVLITLASAGAVLIAVAFVYRPLLFSTLDAEVAEARGVDLRAMSVVLLLILAVTTSVAAPIVGVLLTFSLIVGPAATAAVLASRPPRALALSVALSVGYIWVGLAVSYWIDFPPSVFVTGMALGAYVVARAYRSAVPRARLRLAGA